MSGGLDVEVHRFSIGSKGYIGTGTDANNYGLKDFWEYDSTTNIWTQKADFEGGPRFNAVGFSSGSKGYIVIGGWDTTRLKDVWEYDPATNIWSQKADFPGGERMYGVGFSIGSKGYIGLGNNGRGAPWEDDNILY
jgi:N-acetylneuraminic acid mutarotase